jgi:3-deoxy-7-phosphoheptulonate synthase
MGERNASGLGTLRKQIDTVDDRLVDLLGERLRLVREVVGEKADRAIRDPAREQEVLARLRARADQLGIDAVFLESVFASVFDESHRTQERRLGRKSDAADSAAVTVAYQGIEGAYSELAARRYTAGAGGPRRFRGYPSFAEVIDAVHARSADLGCLPIENTTTGSIAEVHDLIIESGLSIVGEEVVNVAHCLLAVEPVALSDLRRVLSHPQALAQCARFLAGLAGCESVPHMDTADAARTVAELRDPHVAAIASEDVGGRYGLTVVRRNVSDRSTNLTRFVVVAREPVPVDPRIDCRTTMVVGVRHEHGALARCLAALADHGLNLTRIESRPRPNSPWRYMILMDFVGNIAEPGVRDALAAATETVEYLRVLGSYPIRVRFRDPSAPADRTRPRTEAAMAVRDVGPAPAPDGGTPTGPSRRAGRTAVHVGPVAVGGSRPIVIAGPCSVESPEQIQLAAEAVRRHGDDMLRGGCFKPRTSPHSFQGYGLEALAWLAEAGRRTGLPIVTEVLHPSDVPAVAEVADVLQIGTRNMQNAALLKAVGAVDRPVLLKRGMSSTIDEWLQAAEYVLVGGNQRVILCERGIRTFETATRNTLDLSVIPVLREKTPLPVIVDPSHACGVARWVPSMSAAALAAGADGVMIEVHPDPGSAMSDGAQSLDLDAFADLMNRCFGAPPGGPSA